MHEVETCGDQASAASMQVGECQVGNHAIINILEEYN